MATQTPQPPKPPPLPTGAVNKKFEEQSGGMDPRAWYRQLGYTDKWINEHLVKGAQLGAWDYMPSSQQGKQFMLEKAYDIKAPTYEGLLGQFELPFAFAGLQQFQRNLGDQLDVYDNQPNQGGNKLPAWLRNVSAVSAGMDPKNFQQLLLGRTMAGLAGGRNLKDDLAQWKKLVPDWVPGVAEKLKAQGIPFSTELFMSPGLNLTDPSKPLFGAGENPLSLQPLTGLQSGETEFYRSLSAQELMEQVWPSYYKYAHRAAGAPVPKGMEAGMTFGSPVIQPNGTYLRSPIMSTPGYQRYSAYGMPGDYTQNGRLTSMMGTAQYTPLTGKYYAPSYEEVMRTGQLDSQIAAYTQMTGQPPSRWLIEQWITQGLQPGIQNLQLPELDDAARARLMALMGQ